MKRTGLVFWGTENLWKHYTVKAEKLNSQWAMLKGECENISFSKIKFDHSYSYLISLTVAPTSSSESTELQIAFALEKFCTEYAEEVIYYEYVQKNLISKCSLFDKISKNYFL